MSFRENFVISQHLRWLFNVYNHKRVLATKKFGRAIRNSRSFSRDEWIRNLTGGTVLRVGCNAKSHRIARAQWYNEYDSNKIDVPCKRALLYYSLQQYHPDRAKTNQMPLVYMRYACTRYACCVVVPPQNSSNIMWVEVQIDVQTCKHEQRAVGGYHATSGTYSRWYVVCFPWGGATFGLDDAQNAFVLDDTIILRQYYVQQYVVLPYWLLYIQVLALNTLVNYYSNSLVRSLTPKPQSIRRQIVKSQNSGLMPY